MNKKKVETKEHNLFFIENRTHDFLDFYQITEMVSLLVLIWLYFYGYVTIGHRDSRFGHRNSRFGHQKLQVIKNIDLGTKILVSGTEILVLGTRILSLGTNLRAPKYVNLGTEIVVLCTKNHVSGSKIYV